jgi:hypothetical protein
MSHPPLIPPNRLLAWYRAGTITRAQWLEGMRQQFLLALAEIEADRVQPKQALLETWRCRNAARRLTRNHTEAELREVFVSLSEIDDFPPASYLWNADQTDIPLHCFLRERRIPILRFKRINIHRLAAKLTIQYGGPKAKDCILETIHLRRDWRGVMIVESRESS